MGLSRWDGRPCWAKWAEKCGPLPCPFPWGQLGPHLTQCGLSRGLPFLVNHEHGALWLLILGALEKRLLTYLHTKWHLDPSSRVTTTDMDRKLGELCPFWGELGPHLTLRGQWPGSRPTSIPSGINRLATIHNTLTSQTGQTDRQGSGSIRQTVLQTVTQKLFKKTKGSLLPNTVYILHCL